MCYNISYLTKKKLEYAKRFGETGDITDLEKTLIEIYKKANPVFYTTGFDHPDVPVITNSEQDKIQLLSWGLIPYWVKDSKQAVEISNKTLNARGEDMFDKPSYKVPARRKRCLVLIDGFYEYHWQDSQSYPFYITMKNGEPMALAGLWDTWKSRDGELVRNTFSIVTTRANKVMEYIHNKPRGSEGPRMPLIIPCEAEKEWLSEEAVTEEQMRSIKNLIKPYDQKLLNTYTVGKLKGKNATGNTPKAIEKVEYPELI